MLQPLKDSNIIFKGNIADLITKLKRDTIANPSEAMGLCDFAEEKSTDDIFEKLKNGCPVLAAKYHQIADKVVFKPAKSITYNFENEGLFYDIPTMLTGIPEYWLNEQEQDGHCKSGQDIYINVGYSAAIEKEQIFAKLIKIVELIDAMEGAGQRLNIFLVDFSICGRGKHTAFQCKIKDQSETLNFMQLVYLMAAPAFQRFCILLSEKVKGHTHTKVNIEIESKYTDDKNLLYIPSISHDINKSKCVSGNYYNLVSEYAKLDMVAAYNLPTTN